MLLSPFAKLAQWLEQLERVVPIGFAMFSLLNFFIFFFTAAFAYLLDRAPTRTSVQGKITFNFYDNEKCPLTPQIVKAAISAIEKSDAVIGKETIPSIQIDEGCNPQAFKGQILLGKGPHIGRDTEFGEPTVVHEYGHIYFKKIPLSAREKMNKDFNEFSSVWLNAKLRFNSEVTAESEKVLQPLRLANEGFSRQQEYMASLDEYFADVFTLMILEREELVGRNYRPLRFLSKSDQDDRDPHHALKPLWSKTYELVKKTFGDPQKKRDLLDFFVKTIQKEISENLNTLKDKPFDKSELAKRLEQQLFKSPETNFAKPTGKK